MERTSATCSSPRAISPASPMPKSNKLAGDSDMTDTEPIRRIAIIGTGVIGASWTALFLAKGLQVVATDIAPNAETALRKFVETAWPALKRLGLAPGASQSNLKFTVAIAQAVSGVDLVQENGPERIDFKKKLYGQLDELLPPEVIIASSSSGLTMSEIQLGAASHPERCVIAHPFNPPHLIPLTEIVGGAKTSEATIRRAAEFYTSIGQRTVRLNKEMPGHVANRLQGALAREVYYLVAEGVVSAADSRHSRGAAQARGRGRQLSGHRFSDPDLAVAVFARHFRQGLCPGDGRIFRRARRRRSRPVHSGDAVGHVSRDDGPGGPVANSRLLQNGARAARLEQTRMAGSLRARFLKGSC